MSSNFLEVCSGEKVSSVLLPPISTATDSWILRILSLFSDTCFRMSAHPPSVRCHALFSLPAAGRTLVCISISCLVLLRQDRIGKENSDVPCRVESGYAGAFRRAGRFALLLQNGVRRH